MKKVIFILFLFGMTKPATAQNNGTGNWYIYAANPKINRKLNWHHEVQYRSNSFLGNMNQFLFRTGIGYGLLDNHANLLLGYVFIQTRAGAPAEKKNITNEHRIFQQFMIKQKVRRFYMQHRYRLEERFLPNNFKLRFRYHVSVNRPISKKSMEAKAIYLSVYNEIFFNNIKPVFDRNRLYGGMGYCLNNHIRVETGYMAQMMETGMKSQFQIIFFNNLLRTQKNKNQK